MDQQRGLRFFICQMGTTARNSRVVVRIQRASSEVPPHAGSVRSLPACLPSLSPSVPSPVHQALAAEWPGCVPPLLSKPGPSSASAPRRLLEAPPEPQACCCCPLTPGQCLPSPALLSRDGLSLPLEGERPETRDQGSSHTTGAG